jgi:hypothetical protein
VTVSRSAGWPGWRKATTVARGEAETTLAPARPRRPITAT